MNNLLSSWKHPGWKKLSGHCSRHCVELFADGAIWIAGILMLGLANAALGFLHLPARQMEMLGAIHLNTVYATILVASAAAISRLVVAALERMGHWQD